MTTTAIGHAISATVMLAMCPIALSKVGISEELEEQLEITEPSLNSEIVPRYQDAVVQESDDDDIVEIVS